jgi:hypothetical protein
MELKIRKEVKRLPGKRVLTTYFANGFEVCTTEVTREAYCTIKNGSPSNVRDRYLPAYYTRWNRQGLSSLMGGVAIPYKAFKDGYPDTVWGDKGFAIKPAGIKERVNAFLEELAALREQEATLLAAKPKPVQPLHTEGNWFYNTATDIIWSDVELFGNNPRIAKVMQYDMKFEEMQANGHLLASAPKMLELLKKILGHYDNSATSIERKEGFEEVRVLINTINDK